MKKNELNYKDLKNLCNPDVFDFETTEELDNVGLVYGQERAVAALKFGLSINTKEYISEIATKQNTPDDWCYIYNFENPNEPIAVSLPAGEGRVFAQNMDSLIEDVKKYLKRTFNNEDFEKEKKLIKQKYEEKRERLLDNLNKETLKNNFQVKAAPNGIYMLPVFEGKALDETEFEKLDDKIKSKLCK